MSQLRSVLNLIYLYVQTNTINKNTVHYLCSLQHVVVFGFTV